MTVLFRPMPIFVVLMLAGSGLSTGCSVFQPHETTQLNAQVVPGQPGNQPYTAGNSYTVEIRTASGKSQSKQQELSGPLHVQDALTGTKADKKFKRFFIALDRPLPDGRVHNMNLQYDRSAKRIDPEFDYGILPGDRIIVTEDTTTVIDEFLDAASGPLGGATRVLNGGKSSPKYKLRG